MVYREAKTVHFCHVHSDTSVLHRPGCEAYGNPQEPRAELWLDLGGGKRGIRKTQGRRRKSRVGYEGKIAPPRRVTVVGACDVTRTNIYTSTHCTGSLSTQSTIISHIHMHEQRFVGTAPIGTCIDVQLL